MKRFAWIVGCAALIALPVLQPRDDVPVAGVGEPPVAWPRDGALDSDGTLPVECGSAVPAASHGERFRMPVLFAENRGQVGAASRYVATTGGVTAHLLDDRIALQLLEHDTATPPEAGTDRRDASRVPVTPASDVVRGANVHLRFEAASDTVAVSGESKLPTVLSYFLGNDPERWVTRAPCFGGVRYEQVWPGIDIVVRGDGGRLEYDLLLEPGADLDQAVIAVEGAGGLEMAADGSLRMETPLGTLRQQSPRTWQVEADGSRRLLACAYRVLDGERFGFEAPGWTGRSPLVVDPAIEWGSYLGGAGHEQGYTIAVAQDGGVLVGGFTDSPSGFPITPGAFDTTMGSFIDGFVARFSPSGDSLEMAVYVGGNSAQEDVDTIVAMSDGSVIAHGGTGSSDFPVTANAYSKTFHGVKDLFVMRIAEDGGSLLYSTLIGGVANDIRGGCSVDAQERVILTGDTYSSDYPVTVDAAEPVMDGHDMFITCLSADGSSLDYSSFVVWNGSVSFVVSDLAPDGSLVVAGRTSSQFLPVTPGSYDTSWNGLSDLYVMSFDASFQLEWCTYLGGADDEWSSAIAVDDSGHVHVAGETTSAFFPTTPGCFDSSKSGSSDAYVSKLSPDGTTLQYSTFLGGASNDIAFDLAVDAFGCAVVAGETGSTDFPIGVDALPFAKLPFLSRLSPDGSHLWTSTLLGDPDALEDAYGLALGPDGSAYVTGFTWSTSLPGTAGAFDNTLDGTSDSFVLKVDLAAWTDLGSALAPATGDPPVLAGHGELLGGNPISLRLTDAKPNAQAYLLLAVAAWNAPFKGGTLVPAAEPPFGLAIPLATDGAGTVFLPAAWPAGVPHGIPVYAQCWLPDADGLHGFTASNAVVAVTVE